MSRVEERARRSAALSRVERERAGQWHCPVWRERARKSAALSRVERERGQWTLCLHRKEQRTVREDKRDISLK